MNGRRIAGIIAIVLSVVVGVGGLVYMGQHPHRALALFVLFVILLVVGILLVALKGGKASPAAK